MREFPIPSLVVEQLGWVWLHSLWQFALIALLAAVTVRLLRRNSAALRYVVLGVAMAIMVVVPAATWMLQQSGLPEVPTSQDLKHENLLEPAYQSELGNVLSATNSLDNDPLDSQPMLASDLVNEGQAVAIAASNVSAPNWSEQVASFMRPWLAWIVVGWGVGVVLCSVRPLLGWHTLRRLRRVGVSPVSNEVIATLRRVSRRLGRRRVVRVLNSTLARVPIVVGYFRPVILLPISLVTSIPATQLEAILAHELAHVRRQDFLVNLLQTLVETVFFYHPAVWWLSSRLRAERENCCDDLVVNVLGNRVEYGRALLAIEELRGRGSVLAIGAADGSLLARVRRIGGLPSNTTGRLPWPALSLFVCGIIAVCAIGVLSWQGLSQQSPNVNDPSPITTAARVDEGEWGKATNGLRARVVPVLSSMSEDAIDPAQRVAKFEKPDDVAFVVEVENVSDKPINLLDTRYGDGYGKSKGKANSNWYGQFLFSIDLFDGGGQPIERPDVQVVNLNSVLDGVLVASLESGKSHRFLLRPAKWLSAMTHQFEPGRYRAVVRYHGLPARVAARMKEYRPDSPALEAVAGDVVSQPAPFEIASLNARPEANEPAAWPRAELVWGEPTNGLRAAMSFVPSQSKHGHSKKPELKLHVQNVSAKPITLASFLSLSELGTTVNNEAGEPVAVSTTFYSGWAVVARATLKPKQIVIFDAGNVGLAITKERASSFDGVTNRTLVAPAGKYTMQLSGRFGNSFSLKDGKGKLLAPLEGDWVGDLKTGVTPFEISNETIECSIIDAVNGQPVAGTTVNFRFIKPKSVDAAEEIVDDVFWGPQAPSSIYFYIPDKVLGRADRDEIEVAWGVGGQADYEPYDPQERIPLKPFFHEGPKTVRETLGTIKLMPKKKADESISLADAVRDFNAENQLLKRGLDQPPLTEEDVVAAIKRSDWKRDVPDVSERAFAAFKAVAETRRLPNLAYLQVWTSEEPEPFTVVHTWNIQLYMPKPAAGFDGFTIRNTKRKQERIDPKSVAWGKPDADGLSLGLYLLPHKEKYQFGDRVQLRLFVRNDGKKAIDEMTFSNITWPEINNFTVIDQNGTNVEVRNSQIEEWSNPKWIAGAMGGGLDPGDVHAFRIPFELGIGGDGANKLVGRVIDARPGQTLQLRLRAHNGSNRIPVENEAPPESGSVTFKVAAVGDDAGSQATYPPLEFRFAAQSADGKFEPRVPADFEQRQYPDNNAISRSMAKDNGLVWVKAAGPRDTVAGLPVEELRGEQRVALLADTPEHALAWDGKGNVEGCRVVPARSVGPIELFSIELKLDEAGGKALRALTKSHLNQSLAIVVKGEIILAPIVREEFGQNIAITGNFTREQADELAAAICSGNVRSDVGKPPANQKTNAEDAAAPVDAEAIARQIAADNKALAANIRPWPGTATSG